MSLLRPADAERSNPVECQLSINIKDVMGRRKKKASVIDNWLWDVSLRDFISCRRSTNASLFGQWPTLTLSLTYSYLNGLSTSCGRRNKIKKCHGIAKIDKIQN